MHYRPYYHHQQVVEQHPYYQYTANELQAYYSSSEHHEEDNDHTGDEMPSETSGDQSPNADMFRLAFAASQWSKLVLNAEGLFNKLMSTNALPPNEQHLLKNQIEQWLCMKQEYEECITGDDSASLQGYTENTRRSLERIEEVTETDEKTDESSNWMKLQSETKSCSGSESEGFDDEDQSDMESENPDFLDKLDEYMKKFKVETDEIIDSRKNDFSKLHDVSPVPKQVISSSFVPIVKSVPIRNPTSRRISILPNSEMSHELAEFQKQNSHISLEQKEEQTECPLTCFNSNEKNNDNQENLNKSLEEEKSSKAIIKAQDNASVDPEHVSMIKKLMVINEEKLSKVKKIQFDLDLAYKQFEELQNTIKVKEQFIDDMLQSCDARNSAKQKFQKKRNKFEEKYHNVEKVLNYKRMHKDIQNKVAYNEEIEKYENLLMYYEKKLKDTKVIKQVAGNSAKTVLYLKSSLSASKKQLEKLKQRLKDEEQQKKVLEDEVFANKKKIKEIDKKSSNGSYTKGMITEYDDEKHHRLKNKCDDKDTSLVEANERISRLDHLLKEKLDLERLDDTDENETLRQEIRSLRHIRDRLIDMKCKYSSERIPTTVEEQRQMLLISEYVETIDAMIEQKNVMICGKVDLNKSRSNNKLEDQMPIMSRLEKLSHDELMTLFNKYFYKVIDLKDSSKNLEIQNATLEETLKKQEIEHDTRMIMLQKSYERQISLLLSYYAEETSSSSYDDKLDKNKDFERVLRENHALRRRLDHFETLLKASGTAQAVQSNPVRSPKPVLKPELMQVALPQKTSKTTKVTRRGNKLIIQTSKKEK